MSDVGAAILSVGEPHAGRARESAEAQLPPPAEIVNIEGVSPFHRALNEAARRMTSPFFVQVDADMILDRDCFAELRGAVRSDTGIVVGELRDPMAGHTVGVKLFRKACFADAQASDSVSPDTDFGRAIRRRGWKTVYAARPAGAFQATRTFGEHRPDYTPPYTWRKFLLEGGRLRYRGAQGGLRSRIARLESSGHPQARLALLALSRGFFRAGDHDGLVPMDESADADPAVQLLESRGRADEPVAELVSSIAGQRLSEIFRRFFAAGRHAALLDAGVTVNETLDALARAGDGWRHTIAKIGYAHGAASFGDAEHAFPADEEVLRHFVTSGTTHASGLWERVIAAARYRAAGMTGRRAWRW